MELYHTETIGEIEYRLYATQDDLQVRGNALVSGDDDDDRQAEDEIIERLESGDVWAWASVKVEAVIEVDGEEITGEDYLGACSYADYRDFIEPGGYYDDMKVEAKNDLRQTLWTAVQRGKNAVHALEALAETFK
jgi:hypothetical protein